MALTVPSTHVKVVCRPVSAPGFALAGMEVELAHDATTAAAALRRLGAEPRVGMVLIDDALFLALPADVRLRLEKQPRPIVAPFPGPAWDAGAAAEAYILEILRQAIGYRVRPR